MANSFTVNPGGDTVFGNMRVKMGVLTMTDGGAGSSVASGFGTIYGAQATPLTATSQCPGMVINANVPGDFKVQSCSAGDTFHVILYGR